MLASLNSGCGGDQGKTGKITKGIWRAVIFTQGQELPFMMEIKDDSSGTQSVYLINGEERLNCGIITRAGDSIVFPMHIFDTKIIAYPEKETLAGYWVKNYVADYIIPFRAEFGKTYRFTPNPVNPVNPDGKWETVFANESDTTHAIGVFETEGAHLSGTFLLTSGDYRYLDGEVDGDSLRLSTFDGEHAYLFKARMSGDSMTGMYWSGKTWSQPWTAVKNNDAELPSMDSLTFLKPEYTKIDFSFPGLDGKPVTPDDEKFRGKVLILQVFGTWCPNCMDETIFMNDWYRKNRQRGVEILGLAFERKDDFAYASGRIRQMKEKLGVEYDFVIAGRSGAGSTAKALPMLEGMIAFPTAIIIDRNGNIRRIHTGFSGPGTGIYYERYIEEFVPYMDKLLSE
ncbi:MAG TPA: TlpA disulfide reductase family protein [Cyclobacteriaceae bacterium]|nr:TlpA disulfide reductase family protein [Cyclobacteriaceae bacterium]